MIRSMSYDEIAQAFGIERDSARKMVRRKGWVRQKANDGTMRIQVPEESLPRPGDGDRDSPIDHPADDRAGVSPAPESEVILSLSRMIEGLRAENAELRVKAAEHDVLAVQLETLKVALEESRRERDRWATQAHALAHAPVLPPAPAPARGRWWRLWSGA